MTASDAGLPGVSAEPVSAEPASPVSAAAAALAASEGAAKRRRSLVVFPAVFALVLGYGWAGRAEGSPATVLGVLAGVLATVVLANPVNMLWLAVLRVPAWVLTLGAGALESARIRGSRVVLKRSVPITVVYGIGDVAHFRQWRPRIVAAAALTTATMAAAAGAAWAVPGGWGTGVSFGLAYFVVQSLLLFREPGSLGWLLFVLPRRPARDEPAGAELRAMSQAATVGDTETVRRLLDAGAATGADAALAWTGLALADGRNADAAALAAAGLAGEPPADAPPEYRSINAHFAVRAAAYLAEESAGGVVIAPAPDSVENLAAIMLTAPEFANVGDAYALQALQAGQFDVALRRCKSAMYRAESVVGAAHIHCTAARAFAADGRDQEAARSLAKARKLAPGLPRIAVVERLLSNQTVRAED